MENDKNKTLTCAGCQQPLDLGVDVIAMSEGVIGPRGFVRLNESTFCGEDCLREHLGGREPDEVLPRRVP